MDYEKHHLQYPRAVHEALVPTRKIRQLPQHIPPVETEVEAALHKGVIAVPSLDYYTAIHTLQELQPSRTYIGSVYNLMNAIDRASNYIKTTQLQKEMAQLAIYGLEQQIPFLRAGLMTTEVGGRV